MNKIRIGRYYIGRNRPCFIIAEVGVNHNGKFTIAKKLIDKAKGAGADAVKFQTFKTELLVTSSAKQASYQRKSGYARSQYEMLKKLELPLVTFKKLFDYCKRKKILFLSTPFDAESARFLNRLGLLAFKIGSGDLTNMPLLKQIASYGKPLILSTGMATMAEIKESVEVIRRTGNKKIILLQCTTDYPVKASDANLKAIDTLTKEFKAPVGYSDHTLGIEIAIAAVARGACIIEKHFTLSKTMKGPDHKASLEPVEFKEFVDSVRNVEKSLGNGIKRPAVSENRNKEIVRKSIVAAEDIEKGALLNTKILTIKRPGTGIAPKYLPILEGRQVLARIRKDEVITWDKLAA